MKTIEEIFGENPEAVGLHMYPHLIEIESLEYYNSYISSILSDVLDKDEQYNVQSKNLNNTLAEIMVEYKNMKFSTVINFDRMPSYIEILPLMALLNAIIGYCEIGKSKYFACKSDLTCLLLLTKEQYNLLLDNRRIFIANETKMIESEIRKEWIYRDTDQNPKISIERISR